ncbi:MAG: ABC transporter permease [Gemmatimonadaceae bacterium]
MRRFLLRRLAQAALTVLLVATVAFALIHLAPGDPFSATLEQTTVSDEIRERWRAAYGFDRPLHEQYVRYLANTLRGDFGYSFSLHRPVASALASAIPNTLLLMGVAVMGSFALGIAVGVIQAVRRGSMTDRVLAGGSLFFYSMPEFWLGLMMLLIFAHWIPIFPPGGVIDPVMHDYLGVWGQLGDRLAHLALPALTLMLVSGAVVARYQRSAVLDVVHQDFVRTARAKGVSERAVIAHHVLRNALLPVITIFGLAFPALLGGAVFVEKVFAWPGMGLLAVNAIATRDYPLVVATVVIAGVMVSLGSMLADVLYAAADPRLRSG